MMNLKLLCTMCVLLAASTVNATGSKPIKLWYKQPANKWDAEALPVGNGRMGAMLFGGIKHERIQFNEQSLWSGDNNWDGVYETDDHGFGSYRNFGEVAVNFDHADKAATYRRALNISTGVHTTSFVINGIHFERDAFASNPDQMMVFRYTASKKAALSGSIAMTSAQGAISIAKNGELSFSGEMPNHLKYAASLMVKHQGGSVTSEGNTLIFKNCSSLLIFLDARTNYKPDYRFDWRGTDPMPLIQQEQKIASQVGYKKLLSRHINDVSRLTGAASIVVGKTNPVLLSLPTDIRLKKYASGGDDPDLEETMFQYGRYLLISCSRPGGLPANLQGLWNDSNSPPWAGDYHNNINIQMNYWAAETTNLSECHIPLIDFIVAAEEPCRVATRKAFGKDIRGWTARTSQNIFGGNGWEWNIPSSAWYAKHVFDHWDFTRDHDYLRKTAYPMIKEICQFWEDRLKQMPDGSLMVPNGWSPEHGPREDGVMMDQQLVWDLFQNYLEAAKALNIDTGYQMKIAGEQARLAPNKIGSWGQLQEWQADRDDPNDDHRHTSHLFAVYPGRQINLTQTPALAAAAIISLRSRSGNYGTKINTPFTVESTVGDSRRSWTWPWRCAIWARLGEGERAGVMIRGLLTYNTLPNLFCSHPPFQMDGNFGISGAIAEMLLQSQTGEIQLLPAVPKSWAAEGAFYGLKARGGFTVDCKWLNGKITSYQIYSEKPMKVKLRVNSQIKEVFSARLK
ncbi:glycoside hydrolase N-terminal domain-containing protein [Mucilaginibacter sp. BT774]|uniref:glycoside hydrolase family 95 protein n=1 Tax=Mucilaginibacter sp. BT774 TaxID=3062276 RepID=UPI0026765807|nr:glycoside hydrolase N-terminal domain-containing protein [Mucilaginibacter sp. BT774]MDO3627516.1 glycoside hydrolase N-terminal domain-containing protein [Mucilaginibacter sp. BT774]